MGTTVEIDGYCKEKINLGHLVRILLSIPS